jgi:hypothetical protein
MMNAEDDEMEINHEVTNRRMKKKIGEFKQFPLHAVVGSGCHREGRHIGALLLGVMAMFSFGCQYRDEGTASKASQISNDKVVQIKATKDCPYELSQSFRDAAGDAFDKLQSLESNELQGQIFYQPAYQEAVVGVLKARRIASNPDEVKLSAIIASYRDDIDLYRMHTNSANILKDLESMAGEDSWVGDKVLDEHPHVHQERSNAVGKVREDKENQRKNRAILGACLNASHETKKLSDYQSLIAMTKGEK